MATGKGNRIIVGAIATVGLLTIWNVFFGKASSFVKAQPNLPEQPVPEQLVPEQPDLPGFCSFYNATQQNGAEQSADRLGTVTEPVTEPVIILGKLPNAPYVVVVPGSENSALNTVRQCVPDAFQTRSKWGVYIHVGAFPRRADAEQLSRYLRALQLDARVMYLP